MASVMVVFQPAAAAVVARRRHTTACPVSCEMLNNEPMDGGTGLLSLTEGQTDGGGLVSSQCPGPTREPTAGLQVLQDATSSLVDKDIVILPSYTSSLSFPVQP